MLSRVDKIGLECFGPVSITLTLLWGNESFYLELLLSACQVRFKGRQPSCCTSALYRYARPLEL